jgi:hypothetical protein
VIKLYVGQLRRGGGGESVVTVLKQLCPFKNNYKKFNDDHNNVGK